MRSALVVGNRSGLQERARGLCAEAGGAQAGADTAAGRRLQQGNAGDVARSAAHSMVDEAAWVDRVARDSGLYRTDPSVKASQRRTCSTPRRDFMRGRTTTWLVNSEGTIVRKSSEGYQEVFAVGTQAADGMRLDRSYATSGVALKDLDTPEVFAKHAVALIASLTDLRKAPLVEEEYHGPVLLSSDASADTLRALVAARSDGDAAPPGDRGAHQWSVCLQLSRARSAGVHGCGGRPGPEDL